MKILRSMPIRLHSFISRTGIFFYSFLKRSNKRGGSSALFGNVEFKKIFGIEAFNSSEAFTGEFWFGECKLMTSNTLWFVSALSFSNYFLPNNIPAVAYIIN